jgi:hypothetical protein
MDQFLKLAYLKDERRHPVKFPPSIHYFSSIKFLKIMDQFLKLAYLKDERRHPAEFPPSIHYFPSIKCLKIVDHCRFLDESFPSKAMTIEQSSRLDVEKNQKRLNELKKPDKSAPKIAP